MLVVDYLLMYKILVSVSLHLSSTVVSYNMTVLVGQSGDSGPQGPDGTYKTIMLVLFFYTVTICTW